MPRKIIQKRSSKVGKVTTKAKKKKKPNAAGLCGVIDGAMQSAYGTQIKNPMTGRMIKVGGPTFNDIRSGCSWCSDATCDRFEESGINPRTGNHLKANSAIRRNLLIGCESCRIGRDAAVPPSPPPLVIPEPIRQVRPVLLPRPSEMFVPSPPPPPPAAMMEEILAMPSPPPLPSPPPIDYEEEDAAVRRRVLASKRPRSLSSSSGGARAPAKKKSRSLSSLRQRADADVSRIRKAFIEEKRRRDDSAVKLRVLTGKRPRSLTGVRAARVVRREPERKSNLTKEEALRLRNSFLAEKEAAEARQTRREMLERKAKRARSMSSSRLNAGVATKRRRSASSISPSSHSPEEVASYRAKMLSERDDARIRKMVEASQAQRRVGSAPRSLSRGSGTRSPSPVARKKSLPSSSTVGEDPSLQAAAMAARTRILRAEQAKMIQRRREALLRVRDQLKAAIQIERPVRRGAISGYVGRIKNVVRRRKVAAEREARARKLLASRVDLFSDEVEAFMFDGLGLDKSRMYENILPVGDVDQAEAMIRNMRPEGGVMIMNSGGHFATMRIFLDESDMYNIDYYEPFGHAMQSFTVPLRKLIRQINGNRRRGTPTLKIYPLGWQNQVGPCGIYAAYIAKALLDGHENDLKNRRTAARFAVGNNQIRDAYTWIARNFLGYNS